MLNVRFDGTNYSFSISPGASKYISLAPGKYKYKISTFDLSTITSSCVVEPYKETVREIKVRKYPSFK